MHVSSMMRKPEVLFKTPTYFRGGSDYSFARRGGFILLLKGETFVPFQLVRKAGQAFIVEIMFLRENINKGFDYWLSLLSRITKYAGKIHTGHIFSLTS